MKPLAFNLRDAKKIKSDGKTSTFKLGSGHEITILHKALPALQRKQIEKMPCCSGAEIDAMAEGGDVLPKHMKPPKDAKMKAYGINGSAAAYAGGGKVAGDDTLNETTVRPDAGFGKVIMVDAEGGETPDPQQPWSPVTEPINTVPQAAKEDYKKDQEEKHKYDTDKPVKMYADPTEPVAQDDSAPVADAPTDAPSQDTPAPAPAAVVSGQTPEQLAGQVANQQAVPVQGAQPTNTGQQLYGDKTLNSANNLDLENKAAAQQAEVDKSKGASLANMQDGYGKALAANAQRDRDSYNEMATEVKRFDEWNQQNPVNPRHYVENMGAARKVGTAITLFLGGLGAGLRGGSNPALDFLNRQIDRDIDAQKSRVDQERNVFGAYLQKYKDANIASDMTKASLLGIQTNQAAKIASQLATPQAEANFTALRAKNNAAANQALTDAAGRRHVLNQGGNGPANLNQTQPTGGSGAPRPQGKGSAKTAPPQQGDDDHLLRPGAVYQANNNKYDPSLTDDDKKKIKDQVSKADQVDKAIDSIKENFPKMHAIANPQDNLPNNPTIKDGLAYTIGRTIDQIPGYIHRSADKMEDIPYGIGAAISGVGKGSTDTKSNRDYDTLEGETLAPIVAALVQAGLTPTEATSQAKKFLPESGDSEAFAKERMARAIKKIKQVQTTDALKANGFLRQQKK